jgi:signal recognition particle subunit SRP54
VACDIYRPAAVEQLKTVGHALGVPVYSREPGTAVNEIVRGAVAQAKQSGRDVIIVDTAGRLHIDEVKMDELIAVRDEFKPDYTFLVADAMTGQDAVNSAKAFNEQVGIDGVCLTKMDGDARGGAALSIKAVTGKPIVFIGTGEKSDNLEQFHPDRVASRILGMGDVVSLVEKAQEVIEEKDVLDMQEKLASGAFSYDDFVKQMRTIKRMGSLKGLLGMIPGVGQMMKDIDSEVLDKELKRVETIIQSMTKEERANGDLVSKEGRRRERIAKGSGHNLKQVNDLVRQFDQMKGVMQQMTGGGGGGMFGGLGGLFGGGGGPRPQMPPMGGRMPPGMAGMPGMPPGMPGMPPGMPMSKRMERIQKEMMRQQQRELAAGQPRKKKDRKKKKKK